MTAQALAPVFAALGDRTRLQLVGRLSGGAEQSIAQLAAGLQISHQGVTKHLKVLEQAGLVQAHKAGRERRYVGDPRVLEKASLELAHIADQWQAALNSLQQYVETDR